MLIRGKLITVLSRKEGNQTTNHIFLRESEKGKKRVIKLLEREERFLTYYLLHALLGGKRGEELHNLIT